MNEVISFVKGLYPAFLWLAMLGVRQRIVKKHWTSFDTPVAMVLLVFFLGTLLQPLLFYGEITVSRRYLVIAVPLYFAWAADGIFFLRSRYQKQKKKRRLILLFLFSGIAVYQVFDVWAPIVKRYVSPKKRFERKTTLRAAAWIRQDWDGPAFLPQGVRKCDVYQSGRRPTVLSSREELGYLAGGQFYPSYFSDFGEFPDYIAENEGANVPDGYEVVQTFYEGGPELAGKKKKCFCVWKRCPTEISSHPASVHPLTED